MKSPTEEVSSWKLVDPKMMIRRLNGELKRPPVGQWLIHREISPVDLYVYLKARFGKPNGFAMTLKRPTSDNLIHWHWTLQCDEQVIEFMGYNLHAAAVIDNTKDPQVLEVDQFVRSIKADFANHGPAMGAERKLLEKWTLFINPFCRLGKVVGEFRDRLEALNIEGLSLPGLPTNTEQLEQHNAQLMECQAAYTEALGLGVTLRMIAPVWAESFINLILFMLAKPEFKSDERLYRNAIRQEVDIRVKSLHMTCSGFTAAVDSSALAFKDFQTLMNSRNDFLHGNIDPERLKYGSCHFDGNVPLPNQYESMSELALVNSLIHVEPTSVLQDVRVVEAFIVFVLGHLNPQVRQEVALFMDAPYPGWREDTKRLGILFSDAIIHSVIGGSANDAEDASVRP